MSDKIAKDEQLLQIMEMRRAGFSYTDIGRAIGLTATVAAQHVKKYSRKVSELLAETGEEVRRLELQRLDDMLKGVWEKATNGDTYGIEAALKIMKRRAEYLGLDAPTEQRVKLEAAVNIHELSEAELIAIAKGGV